ncbi:MAG: DUF2752 domain-containing protein [Acidimicrobiales bacterium]
MSTPSPATDPAASTLTTLPSPPPGGGGLSAPPRSSTGQSRLPGWGQPAVLFAAGLGACAYIIAVDPNHSSAYPQCPTKLMTGLDCPLCGATRAVHSLLRGNVVGAMDHNLLFVLLLPFITYAFVAWTATRMGHPMKPIPMSSRWVNIPLAVVMVVFTVVRNVHGPLHWLNSATA